MTKNMRDAADQIAELVTDAFTLFDGRGAGSKDMQRAHLMMQAAGALATVQTLRERRIQNLLAVAAMPEHLQLNPELTREALMAAVTVLGLADDEPDPEKIQHLRDLLTDNDPADEDVEK